MIAFLESYGTSNRLMKAILHDLNITEYIAGVKALGLVCKFITCPFWHVLEEKSVHMFDMNKKYLQLSNVFEHASKNVEMFMTGKLLPFGEETYIVPDKFLMLLQKSHHLMIKCRLI